MIDSMSVWRMPIFDRESGTSGRNSPFELLVTSSKRIELPACSGCRPGGASCPAIATDLLAGASFSEQSLLSASSSSESSSSESTTFVQDFQQSSTKR